MTQLDLARALGWKRQSKVSRIESGDYGLKVADVEAWMAATGATPADVTEALRLLEDASVQAMTWGRLYEQAGGMAAQQFEYREREAAASRIVVFQPAIVPGLAQTPEYARRVLEMFGRRPEEIPAAVAARMDRQRILHEPGRDITFVITEAALRLRLGPVGVHLEQLDRLASFIDLPSVTVGVVPSGASAPSLPLSNYELLLGDDGGRAYVEVLFGQVNTGGDEGAAEYLADFDKWLKVAATGDAARGELARVRADLT